MLNQRPLPAPQSTPSASKGVKRSFSLDNITASPLVQRDARKKLKRGSHWSRNGSRQEFKSLLGKVEEGLLSPIALEKSLSPGLDRSVSLPDVSIKIEETFADEMKSLSQKEFWEQLVLDDKENVQPLVQKEECKYESFSDFDLNDELISFEMEAAIQMAEVCFL